MRRVQEASTRHYPRAHRSKQCVTAIDIPAMGQSSVARSVTANSALSGTIAGERRSAQGSARTASRRVARPTEVGYVSCTPPTESRSGAHQMDAFVRRYIYENLCYRFVMLPDGAAAYAVEAAIKSGEWEHGRPFLNPGR